MKKLLLTSLIALVPLACPAQTPSTAALNQQNANNYCRIFFSVAKPGAESQLEEARKKHMQFHKSQNDTWTWLTYQIETGDHAGTYVTSACGHTWADFDAWEKKMGKADTEDAQRGMGPYLARQTNGFYVYRSDMSLAPADRPPAPMLSVAIYTLRPGTASDFEDSIHKIKAALDKKSDFPKTGGWLQLVNGGEGPEFVNVSDRKSWADFAPLNQNARDVTNEAYGKEAADAIYKVIREDVVHLSTETAVLRPDLSYMGGK